MNVVRFNEVFDRMFARSGLLDDSRHSRWRVSPLFEHSVMVQQAVNVVTGAKEMPSLPFPAIRLCITTIREGQEPFRDYRLALTADADGFWSALIYSPSWKVEHLEPVCIARKIYIRNPGKGFRIEQLMFWTGKRWVDLHSEAHDEGKEEIANAVALAVAFAYDAMSPTNHVVEVVPHREGKSVEWTKARTHYTLITHDHPANNKAVQHRATVVSDPTKELQRMAHSRRAHFKTLRHERYKYARGKRIFVRSTWVGPKEWKDEGGRQIYRILEPVV